MARSVLAVLSALLVGQAVAVEPGALHGRQGSLMRAEAEGGSRDVGEQFSQDSALQEGVREARENFEAARASFAAEPEGAALEKGVREVREVREQIFEAARASVRAGVTPEMRKFVDMIAGMVNNDMKPRVVAADAQARTTLQQLAASFDACAADLNAASARTTSFQTQVASQSAVHQTCRTTESSLAAVDLSCAQLLQAQTANMLTACGRLSDLTKNPGTQSTKCEAVQGDSYAAWLARNQVYFASTYVEFLQARDACNNATNLVGQTTPDCNAKSTAHRTQTAQCNTAQASLEQLSCNQQQTAQNGCATYTSCYGASLSALQNQTAALRLQERDRKGEWLALSQIQCLLNVFVQENVTGSMQVDQINACGNATYDTNSLSLTYPSTPAVLPCPQAQPAPCSDAFTTANYGTMPRYTVPAPCTTCASANTTATTTLFDLSRTLGLTIPIR